MPLPSTVDDFLEIVVKSGVLEKEVLDPYLQQMKAAGGMPDRPKKLGAALVRDGLLTAFQVGQFLQGKWRGFCISGKYKLLDHLGAGGMGSVFLCEHKSMRRRVAIKVLPAAQARDPVALERFYREAQAVAALDHPNIVRAHDIDHDGRHHFLVLEYVEGATLQDIVKRGGPMDVTRAAHYLRQAALGLHHAHLAGLVHRDVKPGNLLLDRQGVVKVVDMGLARFFHDDEEDSLTRKHDENNILGTADYLSPEQAINSHAVDIRADVYSLGATFYFLLAGRPPFGDGTVAQKLVSHQMREPEPIAVARPETPEGLAAVVARMMAKDPDQRYQTPAEVYEALAPWTQAPIPTPPQEEMPKSGRRLRPGSAADLRISTPTTPWTVVATPPIFPSAEPTSVLAPSTPSPPAAPIVKNAAGRLRRSLLTAAVVVIAASVVGAIGSWTFGRILTASEVAPTRPADQAGEVTAPDKPVVPPPAVASDAQSFVCVLSLDDLTERVVFTSSDRWDCPVWAPDGKSLLCSSKGKLARLSLSGGAPEAFPTGVLSPGRDYAFTADGRRLAFTSGDAVYFVPSEGGEPAAILPKKQGYVHGLSPDGRTMLYCASRNGPLAIYSRLSDGGEATRLLAYTGFSDGPEFSPDGKWIYFSCDKSGKAKIWRMPAAGAGADDSLAQQVTDDDYRDWFPHPSPDGRWLLFLSAAPEKGGVPDKKDVVLRLMPLSGGPIRELARLTGGQGTINSPCWAPDGKSFAYVRYAPNPVK